VKFTSVSKPAADSFERCIAQLEKKYPSVRADVEAAFDNLVRKEAPIPWPPNIVFVPGLGRVVIKTRVASSDQESGKSGGFRVMLVADGQAWNPFVIYAKAKRGDVPKKELLELLADNEGADKDEGKGPK